jgi:uncharacterized membrane protein
MYTRLAYAFAAVAVLGFLDVIQFGENKVAVCLFAAAVALILLVKADVVDIQKGRR